MKFREVPFNTPFRFKYSAKESFRGHADEDDLETWWDTHHICKRIHRINKGASFQYYFSISNHEDPERVGFTWTCCPDWDGMDLEVILLKHNRHRRSSRRKNDYA